MEEPKFDKTGNKREGTKKAGLLRTVFRYSDMKDMLLMALGTFGCFADGSSTPLIMLVLSRILNKYAVHHSSQLQINKDALTLIYVAVAVGLGAFLEGFCWARTSERQTSSLRKKYLKSVLRQDASFFDKKQDGNSSTYQVISSVSEETLAIQGVLSEKVPNFLTNISTFISSELVALYLCWKLAIVAIPASSLLVIPAVVYGKLMGEIGKKIQATYGVAGEIVEQAFSSIRTVFSYNGENRMKLRFSEALEGGMELGIKQGLLKGLAMGSIGIAFAIWSLQAWYGSILVIEKGAKGGDVFSAGVCIITGGLALGISLVNIKFFTEAAASASVISDLIEQVPKIDPDDQQGKKKPDFRGEFEFKSVDFAYPSRPGNMVLQNFNLRVMAGQTVGLVGGSGCGKSTVISLVERFYDPIHGEILLDGVSLKTVDLKWVRSQIGLVSQEPVLFATSIKENILLGKQGASMEEVINAAKAANAHNFINQLTEAYNTQVGQFGSQLSGGQKQRIAIARALIRNPKILLLDEATSALDSQSEKSVQDALDQASKERTTVIIAHHLSTLCNTNQIVVMQSGKIVESGSHIDLLQNEQGPYFKMVQLQKTCTEHDENSTIIEFNDEQAQVIVEVSEEFDQTIRNIEETKGNPSIWSLMQMAAPEWNSVILGCAAAFCFGAVQPIHSFCMGALLSVYFMNDYTKIKTQTKTYSYVFLINALLAFVANVIQHYNFGFVGERLTKRVREKMVAKMMTFEIEWFEEENNTSGVLCSRLAREANLVRSLVCDRLSLLAQVISAAILAILLSLILSWRLAILIISLQPLIIGSFYARGVLMKSMSRKVLKAQNKSSNLASESVGNHKTIAAFSAEEKVMDLFEVMLEDSKRESQRQAWYAGLGLLISQFLTAANAGLIFWYGARLLNQNKITYKHLFQTFFILVTTGRVIAEAGNMTSDLTKGADAVKSVFMILKRRSKMDPDDPNGIKPEKIKGDIELTNIFFAYPSKPKQMILRDLSLNVETGKSVALVGKSGSGKSTIISMITRFYDPIKGLVKIDGIDAKSYNIRALRSHIALVSQEPPLFAGSIRDNISYGKENATEAEIIEAASHANAHEFISCMKDGYETYCGERGLQLSGGQKQRIALARAILKNPSILLLDEATSALDSESESFVQGAIEKMMTGRTSVIVAHRLSTVQNSELIVVIDKGRIAEQGSHHELIAKREKSLYYSFVRIQQNGLQD